MSKDIAFCKKCFFGVDDNWKFCPNDGTPLPTKPESLWKKFKGHCVGIVDDSTMTTADCQKLANVAEKHFQERLDEAEEDLVVNLLESKNPFRDDALQRYEFIAKAAITFLKSKLSSGV